MATDSNVFVFITGFHRSGTSALARFMASMGVWLGQDLIEAKAGVNDEGFWEHRGVVSINERIFTSLGRTWFDIRPLPENWLEWESIRDLQKEAVNLLKEEFGSQKLAGAKDPRFCRLLPFWLPLIKSIGWNPVVINGYRNISSAANSLSKRDGFPDVFCKLLWLINNTEMEFGSRTVKSAFVEYDYLVDNTEKMAVNLAGYFKEVPFQTPKNFSGIINKDLRHHALPGDFFDRELSPLELLGEEISDNFRAARQPEIQQRMDHIRKSVYSIVTPSPFLAEIAAELSSGFVAVNKTMIALGEMHSHAQRVVHERDHQLCSLQGQVARNKQETEAALSNSERLRSEIDALKAKVSSLQVSQSYNSFDDVSRSLAKTDSEKKIQDLQTTLEKRSLEMRAILVKIKDMQLEIDSRDERIANAALEIACKDDLLAGAENIIASQAAIIQKESAETLDACLVIDQLKSDISRLSGRLLESSQRNHLLMDKLAKMEAKMQIGDRLLDEERKASGKLKSENRFFDEKQQYMDRMLLQLSSELEDAKRVLEERDSYLKQLEDDIAALNVMLAELHAELSRKDEAIKQTQEKYFFLRTRLISRLFVRFGLYKVPHE